MLEHNKNYLKTTGRFWNYCRDEPNSGLNNNIRYSIKDSKSFDYKASITRRLEGNNTEKEVKVVMPLNHLSNFWRILDILLINCEINLILTWSENCILTSKATRHAGPDADPAVAAINNPTSVTFKITDTKLYVAVVTLLTGDDDSFLEELKSQFKRTLK